ncbi:MAG TPA: hypothetical protein VE956_12180 [Nodularia sp. (in: cyanobacteria)]|nr:hypothetical protein [Nodularia sp. (in: cyanobacteria)]
MRKFAPVGILGTPHWNYLMAFPHLQLQNYLCILRSVGVGMTTPRKLSHILSTINDVLNKPAPTACLHLSSSVFICVPCGQPLTHSLATPRKRSLRSASLSLI